MPIAEEDVTVAQIDGNPKPLTDTKKKRPRTVGETTFNWTVATILCAWLILFALAFSLRKYNI